MKKISFKRKATIAINAMLCALLWSAFVYGLISFFFWEGDPEKWPWDGRYFMVFFGFLMSLVAGVAIFVIESSD
jgi:hypothetical protein